MAYLRLVMLERGGAAAGAATASSPSRHKREPAASPGSSSGGTTGGAAPSAAAGGACLAGGGGMSSHDDVRFRPGIPAAAAAGAPSAVVRSWSALLYRLIHGGTDTPLRSIAGAAGRWGDALTSDDGGVARSSDGAGPSRLDDVVRFGGVVSAVRSPPIGGKNEGGGDGVVIDERQLADGDAAESSESLRSTARGGCVSSRPSVGDERGRENFGADTTLAAPPPGDGEEGEAEACLLYTSPSPRDS